MLFATGLCGWCRSIATASGILPTRCMLSLILALLVVALHVLLADNAAPKGYSIHDPKIDHNTVGRRIAEEGDMAKAAPSFHAACRFSGDAGSCSNLGVALMRLGDYGNSYLAYQEALRRDPGSKDAKENLDVLYQIAKTANHDYEDLVALAEKSNMNFKSAWDGKNHKPLKKEESESEDSDEKAGFEFSAFSGATDMAGAGGHARVLRSAMEIANRGKELVHRGEKKLGRAFINLALLLDPWLMDTRSIAQAFDGEEMQYWNGNVFLGHDKNKLEILVKDHMTKLRKAGNDDDGRDMAIYVWRTLQLTDLSCCGLPNLLTWLTSAKAINGHSYIGPLLELSPQISDALINSGSKMQQAVQSFKKWWEGQGRPTPDQPITYKDNTWEWNRMRIMLPADRLPAGWIELMQAVLLFRARDIEAARTCAQIAIRTNNDLWQVADELMPELIYMQLPGPLVPSPEAAQRKYLIQYNPAVGLGNVAAAMVSAHVLAKLTGRTLVLHWNLNEVQRHAFRFKEKPGVRLVLGDAVDEVGVYHTSHRSLYLYHLMDRGRMTQELELLGCSDLSELDKVQLVTMTTNLYLVPLLATNPSFTKESLGGYPEQLADLLEPNPRAIKRALSFANKTQWRKEYPVVAVHIRAREKGEDNDNWPTKEVPEQDELNKLVKCLEAAVRRDLVGVVRYDVFVAATTEKARRAVGDALKKKAKGVRSVFTLPNVERNRNSGVGAIDSMAEALLISNADVFVRMVLGTAGYSTFAHLANALRSQSAWAASLPEFYRNRPRFAPNYVVTTECAPGFCHKADPELRPADLFGLFGPQAGQRSCGDVFQRIGLTSDVKRNTCASLQEVVKIKDEL